MLFQVNDNEDLLSLLNNVRLGLNAEQINNQLSGYNNKNDECLELSRSSRTIR